MGVFCPNCGSKNESTASPCGSCGFRLTGVSASKFKGTMMLSSDQAVKELLEAHKAESSSADGIEGSGTQGSDVSHEPAATQPSNVSAANLSAPLASNFAGTMLGIAGIPRPRQVEKRRKLAGTMLGVAPQGSASAIAMPPPAGVASDETEASPEPSAMPAAGRDVENTQVSANTTPPQNASASVPIVTVTGPHDRTTRDSAVPVSNLSEPETNDSPESQDVDWSDGDGAAAYAPEPGSHSSTNDSGPEIPPREVGHRSRVAEGEKNPTDRNQRHPMTAGEVFLSFATCGLYALFHRLRR